MDKSIETRLIVAGWRRDNWQRLGFELSDAVELAVANDIDYHDVENFVKEHPKCKPQTALQILR